jgi:hypothetical protein
MPAFREILTRIGFKVDAGKIKEAEVKVAGFKKQMNLAAKEARRMRSSLNMALGAAKAMTVAVVGSRAVKALTTAYSGPIDELAKYSKAMGLNVEDMQGWVHGAGLSGASAKELQVGIKTLAVNMHEAATGGKEQAESFRDIGVSVKDSQGNLKTQKQLMMEIADRFAASEDGAVKAALAVRVFGKSGAKLVPFLNEGSKGIEKMSAEAKRLGIVMSEKQTGQAEAFNDSMARVKAVMTGVRNQIAAALIPTLTALGERFQAWAATSGNVAAMLATLGTAAKIAGAYLAWMAAQKISAGLSAIVTAARSAASALRAMGIAGAWAQVKMGLLVGAFAIIGAAVYDMYRITQGQDSFLLKFLGDGSEAEAIKAALSGVLSTLSEMWAELKPAVLALGLALMDVFRELWKALKPIFPYVVKFLGFAIKVIAKILVVVIKSLAFVLKWVAKAIAWLAQYIGPIIAWIGRAWEATAKNVVGAWNTLKAVYNEIYAAGKWVADKLGAAYKWAADVARRAWNALMAPFVWLYDKLLAIYDLAVKIKDKVGFRAFLGMGNFAGGVAEVAADAEKRRRMAATAPGGTNNTVNTGPVNVTVTSSPDMPKEEFQRRIKTGVRDALGDVVRDTYFNRAVPAR